MILDVTFHEPAALLAFAEAEMAGIPSTEIFNESNYQKLRERWCAAMFRLGYAKALHTCQVGMNDTLSRVDVDMYLQVAGRICEFQTAEVQVPGRSRGRDYRLGIEETGSMKGEGSAPVRCLGPHGWLRPLCIG